MMRSALNAIDAHSESTVMVGDRMDTDMISGIEAGLRTILVLTGSTRADQIEPLPLPADPGLRLDRRGGAAGGRAGGNRRTYRIRRSTVLRNRSGSMSAGTGVGHRDNDQPGCGRFPR